MKALFPQTLNRLAYFVRLLIFLGAIYGIAYSLGLFVRVPRTIPIWIPFLVIGALFILRFVCLDIPRCRSMQWSPWLVLLFLVPVVNVVMQLLLLIVPPKTLPKTAPEPPATDRSVSTTP
jgi:uncharacterized membrane protein YhaH (DUF805 family)